MLEELIFAIQSFIDAGNRLPHAPHPATQLLHTRTRFALSNLAKNLKLSAYCTRTNFTETPFGRTLLQSDKFSLTVHPGILYNRIFINPPTKGKSVLSSLSETYPLFACSFDAFLGNPKVLLAQIDNAILKKTMTDFIPHKVITPHNGLL